MGSSMSWLKMATNMGINGAMWRLFFLSVIPTIVFAFVFNLLVVGNVNKWLIKWQTRNINDKAIADLKAGTIRGWTIILLMSFTMSTRAILINGSIYHMTIVQFILGYFGTLTMAYFVRDTFIMPIVNRMLFGRRFV